MAGVCSRYNTRSDRLSALKRGHYSLVMSLGPIRIKQIRKGKKRKVTKSQATFASVTLSVATQGDNEPSESELYYHFRKKNELTNELVPTMAKVTALARKKLNLIHKRAKTRQGRKTASKMKTFQRYYTGLEMNVRKLAKCESF